MNNSENGIKPDNVIGCTLIMIGFANLVIIVGLADKTSLYVY